MPIDDWIVRLLPSPGSWPAFDALMRAASTVGLLLPTVAIPWWLRGRDRTLARAALVGMLVGLGLTLALQLASLRPRPEVALALLPVPPLPSFPSGHMVLITVVLVVLAAHRPRSALAWLPVAVLVGLSRVHVGHHHATDVLGGVLLGLGLGLGAVSHARARPDDRWRHRWLLWPQLGLVLAVSLVAYTGTFAHGAAWWLRLPGMDKTLHFLLFGLLAFGLHLQSRGRRLSLAGRPWPLAVVLPLLGAAAEELVQATSPHRTADLGDLLADLLGLVAFWWVAEKFTSAPRHPEGRRDADP